MRNPATTSTIATFPASPRSFGRRPVRAAFAGFTVLVLFRHHQTEKAIFVSDDGDAVGAVWLPKALLGFDRKDRGPFLVVTIDKKLASEKHLDIGTFNYDRLSEAEREQLEDAKECARLNRQRFNQLSGRREAHARCNGRDFYA